MKPHDSNGAVPATVEKRRTSISVRELEASLPTPEEVAAQAAALRAASVECIQIDDVSEMMGAILAQAKKGDVKSARLILDHLNSHKPERERPKGPAPAAALPALRAEPAEPPRPVAVPGPDADQQRLLVAMTLLAHQPMQAAGLGKLVRLEAAALDAVLNHEWFQRQGGQVRLSPAGRQAVG